MTGPMNGWPQRTWNPARMQTLATFAVEMVLNRPASSA